MKMEEGRITEVSDGTFCTSSRHLDVRPLTLINKAIAEGVNYYSKELHALNANLNYPDIHRYLCSKCYEIIDYEKKANSLWEELGDFVAGIKHHVADTIQFNLNGIDIFRR